MAYQKTTPTNGKGQDDRANMGGVTNRPVITVDYERYAHFLEDADLSEEQKLEFLQALWNVIVEFVSLGFGVHPLQRIEGLVEEFGCGQIAEKPAAKTTPLQDKLKYSDKAISRKFERAAGPGSQEARQGVET